VDQSFILYPGSGVKGLLSLWMYSTRVRYAWYPMLISCRMRTDGLHPHRNGDQYQVGALGATGIPSEGSSGCKSRPPFTLSLVTTCRPPSHCWIPFGCSTHTHTHTQHLRQLRGTTDLPQQLHITPLKSWLIDNGCNVIVPFLGSSFLLNIKSRVRSMEQIVRSSIALQLERFKVPQDWL
jgi:hypothetical protein